MPELRVESSISKGWHLTCDGEPVTLPPDVEGQIEISGVDEYEMGRMRPAPKRLRLTVDLVFLVAQQKEQ